MGLGLLPGALSASDYLRLGIIWRRHHSTYVGMSPADATNDGLLVNHSFHERASLTTGGVGWVGPSHRTATFVGIFTEGHKSGWWNIRAKFFPLSNGDGEGLPRASGLLCSAVGRGCFPLLSLAPVAHPAVCRYFKSSRRLFVQSFRWSATNFQKVPHQRTGIGAKKHLALAEEALDGCSCYRIRPTALSDHVFSPPLLCPLGLHLISVIRGHPRVRCYITAPPTDLFQKVLNFTSSLIHEQSTWLSTCSLSQFSLLSFERHLKFPSSSQSFLHS
jgi:hypothetical protein